MTSTMSNVKNNGKVWSNKSVDYLRRRLSQGWTYSSIGGVLGRTSEAVRKKASRI